ncbi:MAG: thioesterase II family protein [Nocardioides sp.]
MNSAGTWLRPLRSSVGAEAGTWVRVVCLPHAGSGTTPYRPLADWLPAGVDGFVACYPGRENRVAELPRPSIRHMVHEITLEVTALSPAVPVVIYGHSMGAVIAHEVAHELEQAGVGVALLAVSGSAAPQDTSGSLLAELTDSQLLAHLDQLGAGPLDDPDRGDAYADPELRAILLAALRADLRLVESHDMRPRALVRAPLLALYGSHDLGCTATQAQEWAGVASGPFRTMEVEGGDHFTLLAEPWRLAGALMAAVPTV